MGERVRATVKIANVADAAGDVFSEDALRGLADGRRLFYDEATKSLIYYGPLPVPDVA